MKIPFVFILITGLVLAFMAVGMFVSGRKAEELRARGIYPAKGKETDADVLNLLKAGEKIMAIRCYRSIHRVGLKEAKEAVEAIERAQP
jgi:ribosomal protein L7/L12